MDGSQTRPLRAALAACARLSMQQEGAADRGDNMWRWWGPAPVGKARGFWVACRSPDALREAQEKGGAGDGRKGPLAHLRGSRFSLSLTHPLSSEPTSPRKLHVPTVWRRMRIARCGGTTPAPIQPAVRIRVGGGWMAISVSSSSWHCAEPPSRRAAGTSTLSCPARLAWTRAWPSPAAYTRGSSNERARAGQLAYVGVPVFLIRA